MKSRRNILITVGTATSVVLAGCLGDDEDEWPNPPDEETPTEELLPDTDQWPLDRTIEQAAGAIGANDGIQGWWDGPDGQSYSMEIMRFSDESSAEETAEQYIEEFDWFLSLSNGVFSFAVNGPDGVHARELLAASPALNEAFVTDKTPEADGFPSAGSEQEGTSDEETGESEEDESDESQQEGTSDEETGESEEDESDDSQHEGESDIPSEQEAFEVGEEFFQALSHRDIERYDSIISPIAENEFVFENNIPESDIVTSYEVVDIEIRAIQEAHESATIEIDYLPLNADGESITDSTVPYVLHLHVDDAEWKFFDGGDGTYPLPIGFSPIYMEIRQVSIDPERDELSISYSMDSLNNFLKFETSIDVNVKPQDGSETVYASKISSYQASGSIEFSDIEIPDCSDVEIFINDLDIFNSTEDIDKVIDSSKHPTGITYDGNTGVTESYMDLCIANCD